MIYKNYKPSNYLASHIKEFLLVHFDFNGTKVERKRLYIPCPEQCLTFDIVGVLTSIKQSSGVSQKRSKSYFSGQQVSSYELNFDSEYIMLKVVFQPGALFNLYGVPLTEFDGYVDATLICSEINNINGQLANASDYLTMIQIAERYLYERICKTKTQYHPIDFVVQENYSSNFSLKLLASQSCLSFRQFERKFTERIGVSPKLYSRIVRFDNALKLKEINQNLSWLDVAIKAGYSDFQHLNKDFKDFTGVSPTALINKNKVTTEKILQLI